jgi:hypothetical protein
MLWGDVNSPLAGLDGCRNIPPGMNQRCAWNADDSLVRAAAYRGRQTRAGGAGDVNAYDGKIAGFEFKDVGASAQRGGLFPALVGVGTKSSDDFHIIVVLFLIRLTDGTQNPKKGGWNARTKYQL